MQQDQIARSGAAVVSIARRWIGTPYHHQAAARGSGTDCLGLIRGVWRELYGSDPETPPAYSRDWGEADGTETLLAAARRHMTEVPKEDARPGDMLVFRIRDAAIAKHAGILASTTTMIHAMEGVPVSEIILSAWWRRRLASVFRFPGIER